MKPFSEIIDYIVDAGESKTEKKVTALIIQGVLAGMFIAMGAIGYFKLVAYTVDPGIGKFLGALIFPTGIMAILLLGSELFTSNCMAILSVYKKKIKLDSFMKMLITVLCANFVGAVIMAYLSTGAGIFSEHMIDIVSGSAVAKTTMPIGQMFISAILCNIIVCAGVMMAYSAKTVPGKLMAIWFPIAVFVLSGTEHIVANMFYLMMALINGANITVTGILTSFGVVTVGNFIGGAIVIAGAKYYLDRELSV
ncbi:MULTISPECIES: formate/nitrite transporter family protein [unclassified Fusibacter]|uniref:formate/nitrite transporter family protein n=1 Tax=unclassified Fusibacter TaxID=2624464 RepID=UPI0013E991CD|nr:MULTISPECIES: formate/nitrite transporter family protein [unclassified Fusibacter]MCK8059708.1 formate/nitrite transporter family protein [Fusibacter sp. A2]NPE21509.1 formate/nitrite transporter family protein [Fusibacter sp. A1]